MMAEVSRYKKIMDRPLTCLCQVHYFPVLLITVFQLMQLVC